MYTTGHGYKAIANKINRNDYRTKMGKTFSLNAIKTIVTNPVYAGYIRYNVRRDWNEKRRNNINPDPVIVKGDHEAIISEEIWKIAQEVYKTRSCKPNRVHDGEFPLTGIMRCPQCGAGMVIGRTTNKRKDGTKRVIEYYVCGAWKNKGTNVCHSNGVRIDYADPYVINRLENLMKSDKLIKQLVSSINHKQESLIAPIQREYQHYKQDIEKLEKKLSNLLDAYMEEIITKISYQLKSSELEEQISSLKALMEPLKEQLHSTVSSEVTFEQVKAVMQNFSKAFKQALTREQRKRLLHLLIHQITIDENRKIESIQLKLNNEVLEELQLGTGDLSTDESSVPFSILVAI